MERKLRIDPQAAAEHGLPPLALSLDLTGLPLMERCFVDRDAYLACSGPPGGPLFFDIRCAPHAALDLSAQEEWIRTRYGFGRPMSFGPHGTLLLKHQAWPARLFFTGEANAATVGCAVTVARPPGTVAGPGFVLVFGSGGRPGQIRDAAMLAGLSPHAQALASLTWSWPTTPGGEGHVAI